MERPQHAKTIGDWLAWATVALAPVSETARLDAELLCAHALGVSRSRLGTQLRKETDIPGFNDLIERRLAYEPIPYILGKWEFFSLELHVRPPMLVPRPETEHLVEVVLESIGDGPANVIEIGTGTGCVSVAIAHCAPRCRVLATDINPAALELAAENAALHQLEGRVQFMLSDVFGDLPLRQRFDVICSNPPYVEESAWDSLSPSIRNFEDRRALLAGEDGLDIIRRLVAGAGDFLARQGVLAFEIGMGQDHAVKDLLQQSGFSDIRFVSDLAGVPRIACGRK